MISKVQIIKILIPCLITDGIHREVNNNNDVDKQKLDGLIKTKNIFPIFI